jgi:hypothetical protein
VTRRLSYFGFDLETMTEEIRGEVPPELRELTRDALTDALLAGETAHSDQGKVRRVLEELGELWRRSGGTLTELATPALRDRIRAQLEGVTGWETFMSRRVRLDPLALAPAENRQHLMGLPSMVRLMGDAVPLDYQVEDGTGVVELRLREGQLRRLQERDLPAFDRPIRFVVMRGQKPALRGASLDEVRELLRNEPRERRQERRQFRGPRPGGKRR